MPLSTRESELARAGKLIVDEAAGAVRVTSLTDREMFARRVNS